MLWWVARSTSLVALVLLTVTLALGIAAGSGRPQTRVVVQLVHRNASLLAVALVAVHVGTLVVDPHVDLGLVDLVVPFGSDFHRLATGLGTVALDLVLTVAVTSGLRTRLGGRAWRTVHAMAYALWPVAALHGLGAGTDVAVVRWLTLTCAVAVGVAVTCRLSRSHSRAASLLTIAGLATTGALAGVVLG
jgi:sulfoxide reductase heme-binding subunit YedZ